MKNVYYIDRTNRLTSKIKSSVYEYNKLIRDLSTELDRVKESEEYYRKGYAEFYKRIDEAIDKLEESQKGLEEWHFDGYDPCLEEIIEILKGSEDNEKDSNKRTSEI